MSEDLLALADWAEERLSIMVFDGGLSIDQASVHVLAEFLRRVRLLRIIDKVAHA